MPMSIVEGVLVAVLAAGTLAVVGVLLHKPYRRWRTRVGDHGVELHTELNPAHMDVAGGLQFAVSFYFPRGFDPSPPPRRLVDWWEWAHDAGGEDANTSAVAVTIQGSEDEPVSVERPEITCVRSDAEPGVVCQPEGLGGAGIQPRHYVAELSDSGAVALRYVDPGDTRPAAFILARGETERLHIVVHAQVPGRFKWTLHVPIIHNGQRKLLAANDGRPFTMIGTASGTIRRLLWADGKWIDTSRHSTM